MCACLSPQAKLQPHRMNMDPLVSFGDFFMSFFKGEVGNFGETGSRSREFENTQPEEICYFLTEPLLQHTRTRT